MLRKTACLLIWLLMLPSALLAESKTASVPEVLRTYADLLSMRTEQSQLLAGANGIMVLEAGSECSLKPLDIIIEYHKQPIHTVAQLFDLISQYANQKDAIGLKILRAGEPITIQLAAGSLGVLVSDMTATDVSELMGVTNQETGAIRGKGKSMTEYLKGRPYRTPNNRNQDGNH